MNIAKEWKNRKKWGDLGASNSSGSEEYVLRGTSRRKNQAEADSSSRDRRWNAATPQYSQGQFPLPLSQLLVGS